MRNALLPAVLAAALTIMGCATPGRGGPEGAMQPVSQQRPKSEATERARVHVELGRVYLGDGRFDVALEESRLAVESDPDYAPAYDLMGLIYLTLRQFDAAGNAFRQALRLAPADPEIHNDYGWFLCVTGDHARGLEHLDRALANPFYATPLKALTNGGLCALMAKDDARAEAYFRRALQIERGHATALYWLADIAYRRGRHEEAKRLVENLHALIEPTAASLWLALRIERKLGNREQEARLQASLKRKFPDSAEVQKLLRGESD